MPQNVDEDVQVLTKWLDRWTEDAPQVRDKRAIRQRGKRRRSEPPPEPMPAPTPDGGAIAPDGAWGNAMSAMVTPASQLYGEGMWMPGPNVIPLGALPAAFREKLPRDQQWIGLDQTKLDVPAMEALMREKLAEDKLKDEEWLRKNRPMQQVQ